MNNINEFISKSFAYIRNSFNRKMRDEFDFCDVYPYIAIDCKEYDNVEIIHNDILKVDITIRPRNWFDMGHNHRVKAYVKTMFVTVMEDPLEIDYADIPIK